MLKRLSIKLKLVIVILLAIILLVGSSLITVRWIVTKEAEQAATKKAKGDLATGYAILDREYPGSWHLEGDKLYKGDTLMNDNYEIVDYIGNLTGDTVTIFAGDTRVATNVKKNGQRAVGTVVSDEVAETVLENREDFYGEANVVGHIYQTAYTPIENEDGKVIGIWYVGTSKQFVQDMIYHTFKNMSIIYLFLSAIIISIVYFMATYIVGPVVKTANYAEVIAEGDLSRSITDDYLKREDEVGRLATAFHKMVGFLREGIGQVSKISEKLAASSEELSALSEQVAESSEKVSDSFQSVASGAEEQSVQLDETEDYVSQLNERIEETELMSNEMEEKANQVIDFIKRGNNHISASIQSVNNVKMDSQTITQRVNVLGQKSQEIGGIVELINNIAHQTNLLALNAAIEASRAGETGRGFGVVADEIRELAEESTTATQQIEKLIRDIQNEVSTVMDRMQKNTDVVDTSVKAIGETEDIFQQIKDAANELESLIKAVAQKAIAMKDDSQQVETAIRDVSKVSDKAAGYAEEVAASSQEQNASLEEIVVLINELAEMADNLASSNQFKV